MRGGYGTRDHGTLDDRNSGARSRQQPQPPQEPQPSSPARHCHVDAQPSLLVEWRRGDTDWEGRVISVLWIDAVGWASVERWLPAADIAR
jgi:hypothetical protein